MMNRGLRIFIFAVAGSLLFSGIIHSSLFIIQKAHAATNIDSTYRYAWNDVIGWIDFYSTGNVNVSTTQLVGYATSSVGYIALDCATSPNGDICGTSNFKVSNDGSGYLSGWAWNDAIGWISFDSATATSSYPYQVKVSITTGDFSGWAWNDIVGWISFNCSDTSSCGTSNYKVNATWRSVAQSGYLDSAIFDTQVPGGAAFNSIMWQGYKPAGTSVKFQISTNASSSVSPGLGAIDSVFRYAWNDSVGWLDFGYPAGNVNVDITQLTGYAYNSNIFEVSLDCTTSPAGNICGTSNFRINHDLATGDLSGYAWNDSVGWTSFNCSDPGLCATSNYKVSVSTSTGAFTGWAWNDYIGWISFNCLNTGTCGSSNYKVSAVGSSGWAFIGPDGSSVTYYDPSDADVPVPINLTYHNNKRYFRYKVYLQSDSSQTLTPRVDDVIINWSP